MSLDLSTQTKSVLLVQGFANEVSHAPDIGKLLLGVTNSRVFVKVGIHLIFFGSSFQKRLLQHLMGKSEFKKGRATPSAQTQKQPVIAAKRFHVWLGHAD